MSEEIINKEAAKSFLDKIKEKFKKVINATRIPRLVDAIFKHPDNFNAALNEAPKAENNWTRLGLDKTWIYFAIAALVIAIYYGRGALIFFIQNISYAIALIPLAILAWWFIKKIRSK